MKRNKKLLLFGMFVSFFLLFEVNLNSKEPLQLIKNDSSNKLKKTANELAVEFIAKLQNDRVDTIIYFHRQCVSCCDFYYIFWSSNGQKQFIKFKYVTSILYNSDQDTSDQSIPIQINLKSDSIFDFISKNFIDLKKTKIRENVHKLKNGVYSVCQMSHSCNSSVSIYLLKDNITNKNIEDHAFDKYIDFEPISNDRKAKRQLNDNYISNIKSKWYMLLNIIENEIANMSETSKSELNTLRIKQNGK